MQHGTARLAATRHAAPLHSARATLAQHLHKLGAKAFAKGTANVRPPARHRLDQAWSLPAFTSLCRNWAIFSAIFNSRPR